MPTPSLQGDKAADQEFLQFLDANGVPKEVFTGAIRQEIPRYVRVNPRGPFADLSPAERQKAISQALQTEQSAVQLVQWLRAGEVQQSDQLIATGACTVLMLLQSSQSVACSQGPRIISWISVARQVPSFARSAMQSDLMAQPAPQDETGRDRLGVTGVDVAEQRLAACRTVLRKYGILNVKLSLGDGTTWRPNTAEWFSLEAPPRGRGQRGRKRRFEEKAKAETAAATADTADRADRNESCDRVLVDAECTHDASCRHLEKFRTQWGLDSLSGRVPWIRQELPYQKWPVNLRDVGITG
ncbi:unnamed protein product [Cladocopium goreaui]|uniref:SAM-dependent MTase RsmB/NOP-type domain-containing protein n=1 Tax=Cladocopium goreaui TaxID=2562237 RepID=A0A9P1D224_9DINO|nr:unnamed protein product [Cladocopium goreaui]